MLSEGRGRRGPFAPYPLAAFLAGIVGLAFVGAFVVVRALVEWLT